MGYHKSTLERYSRHVEMIDSYRETVDDMIETGDVPHYLNVIDLDKWERQDYRNKRAVP